jgi:Ca-activated chloride channel homolog
MMKRRWATGIASMAVIVSLVMGSIGTLGAESLYSASKKGKEAYDKKDYAKALDHYIQAQLDAPDKPDVAYNLGNAQYQNGNFEDALNQYKEALKTTDNKLKQAIHYNMGNTYFRKKDFEKSLAEYQEAMKIDPHDQDAKKNADFVKKVMEEQKKQKKQSGDGKKDNQNDPDEKDRKNPDKKDQDNNTSPDDNQKQASDNSKKSPDNQASQDSKKDDQKNDQGKTGKDESQASKDQPPPAQNESKADDPEDTSTGGAAKDGKKEPDDTEMKQAQRMLNRLKDTPGKALIPSYESRQVDKDW